MGDDMRPTPMMIHLRSGDQTFRIATQYLTYEAVLVKVGGDQLKLYIESLPADHPDRSEMLELVAEPGIDVFARIAKHPKAVNQREGMIPNPITIHHVKALLVQSRGRFGQPNHTLNYICNCCQGKECEKNGPTHAMPFEDCIDAAGFFGNKCGNCLWTNEQRGCIRHAIFPRVNWRAKRARSAERDRREEEAQGIGGGH